MGMPDRDRSCVYVEYPKCLYNQAGETMTVDNGEEETAAAGMGWMTAEQYHAKPAEPAGVPEGEEGHKAEEPASTKSKKGK